MLTRAAMLPHTAGGPAGARRAGLFARHGSALLYAQLVLLFGLTLIGGRVGIGAVRYAFVVGCVIIGFQSWLVGPAKHAELTIILFVWSPFVRRVIDYYAGFDPSASMLGGPVLNLLPPCIDLYGWLVTGRLQRRTDMLGPYMLMGVCLLYGLAVSVASGDMLPATLGLSKFLPGMLYGLWLIARGGESPNVTEGVTRGFLIAMPLAGFYGIYQYFLLPQWDASWITLTSAVSAEGLGEAEKLRVFGPMNSVASYGHYLFAAVLLLGFVRRSWWSLLLCLPLVTGMMLSTYRTGWIALAVGMAYCCVQGVTRKRAQLILVWILAGAAIILTTTSIGDTVLDRMATFGTPSNDGSGKARVAEYSVLFSDAEQFAVGLGIGGLGPFGDLQPRRHVATEHVDGSVVDAILMMGLVVGSLYLLSIVWASAQALLAKWNTRDVRQVALSAIVLGNLSATPLSSITRGEVGVLFWIAVGALSSAASNALPRARTRSGLARRANTVP